MDIHNSSRTTIWSSGHTWLKQFCLGYFGQKFMLVCDFSGLWSPVRVHYIFWANFVGRGATFAQWRTPFFPCKIIASSTSFNINTIDYRPATSFLRFRVEGLGLLTQNSHSHWSASEQVPTPILEICGATHLHACGLHGLPRSRGVDRWSEHRADTIAIVSLSIEDYSLCCELKYLRHDWTVETFELAEVTWD
jgi:hypothetical protein